MSEAHAAVSGSSGDNLTYYGILNVDKDASLETIKNNYKKLCLVYHPDKYALRSEPEESQYLHEHDDKLQPDNLLTPSSNFSGGVLQERLLKNFQLIQKAYNVLSDENKRYIYDRYGEKGLEKVWTVGRPLSNMEEIKLVLEREEKREARFLEEQGWIVKNVISTEFDFSDLVGIDAYTKPTSKNFYNQIPEFRSLILSNSIEKWVEELQSHVMIFSRCQSSNGMGSFNIVAQLRRKFSEFSSGYISTGTGGNLYCKPGIQYKLGKLTTLDLSLMGVIANSKLFTGTQFNITRVLTPNFYSGFILGTGVESGLSVFLNYNTPQLSYEQSLKVSRYELSIKNKMKYNLNENYSLICKGSLLERSLLFTFKRKLTELISMFVCFEAHYSLGMVFKLGVARKNLKFVIPIILAHDYSLNSFSLSSLLASSLLVFLEKYLFQYLENQELLRVLEDFEYQNADEINTRKSSALETLELLKESHQKRLNAESQSQGLVILEAVYGDLNSSNSERRIDVSIQLQALVFNSQLHLNSNSKVHLLGFYDPLIGKPKKLYVKYLFRNKVHSVTIDDKEVLALPKREHCCI